MPDFRGLLDEAQFKPTTGPMTTTGPNAQGETQQWVNPRPQLDQSSAQQLAQLLGATLVPVNGGGGPYRQDKPQYNLDFGGGALLDASMVAENYARNPNDPTVFNERMNAELASLSRPSVAMQEYLDRQAAQPGVPPLPAGVGGGGTPPRPATPNVPGPVWPQAPPANTPGPAWTLPPLPPMPTGPQITTYPGTGVQNPGGYWTMPPFPGPLPGPVDMQEPSGLPRSIKNPGGLLTSFPQYQYGGLLG